MRPPRGLSPDEAALWARVAATVKPIHVRKVSPLDPVVPSKSLTPPPPAKRQKAALTTAPVVAPPKLAAAAKPRPLDRHGLDGTWDRKLATAAIQPDFTLDLHGCNLDAAHDRLDHGLFLAASQGARVVLVVTGRPRPVDAADRGEKRGAIRAKLLDWLAAGRHASQIAAVRPAHPRHGGAGAVYVVLKRAR
ncbi:MAG: Smr/MutS family protein [Novosphingobium sp.]